MDTNKVFREQLIQCLSTVLYNGQPLPVYDGENPKADTVYIVIGEQTGTDAGTKTSFDYDCTVLIDIVHRYKSLTFSTVDTIAGEVKRTLRPTPQTVGIESTDSMQIALLRCTSDQKLHYNGDKGYVMRRLLRYSFTITEKL